MTSTNDLDSRFSAMEVLDPDFMPRKEAEAALLRLEQRAANEQDVVLVQIYIEVLRAAVLEMAGASNS